MIQELNEYVYLMDKYPHVAFNLKSDRPRSDGFFPKSNTPEFGFRHLVILEPCNEIPEQWNIETLKQYKSSVTWNSKFFNLHKNETNLSLIKGCTFFNNHYQLEKFLPYDEKIKGVCFINKIYDTPNDAGTIIYMREKVLNELAIEPYLVKHVYSLLPWGGNYYQGPTLVVQPSHIETLKVINKYLFRVCFESLYHPIWSWDFMTERMFDCFKSKTIPIYLGCYNIEEHVPKELFIDFRDFNLDAKALSDYLISFPKNKYIEMTEAAYEWNKINRIGSTEDLEKILCTLP